MKKTKNRLDVELVERELAPSRAKAQRMIMAGEVSVDGQLVDKPGTQIRKEAQIHVREKKRFVSRGGNKLAGALDAFALDPTERIAADVGACTGGFTDCLLQRGTARVYAIDVGYGQLDYSLRRDERVVVMERTNARYLEDLDEPIDLVVVDASFISLKLLLPAIQKWLTPQADVIALIKPQFEAGKADVGKGGIVRDPAVHKRVLEDTLAFAESAGFAIRGLVPSSIKGSDGNVEFLAWLAQGDMPEGRPTDALIQEALAAAQ